MYVTAADRSIVQGEVRSTTATVTVSVERNVAPVIQNRDSYTSTISEGISLNEAVAQIQATDANPADSLNGQLVYSIDEANARELFQIDNTGLIRARVQLKDTAQLSWTFNVTVSDQGIPALSDTTRVSVTITEIIGIVFNPGTSDHFLTDNTLIDTEVFRIAVTDPTPDGPIVYEIRGDGLAPQFFRLDVDGDIAVISVNKSLMDDTSNTPVYTVRIYAYRQNDPLVFAEHVATIRVERNPGAPDFNHGDLYFLINENYNISDLVGIVNATDPDTGANGEIRYSFTNDVNPLYSKNFFVINPTTGEIRVIGVLRNDPQTYLYRLQVEARDGGATTKSDFVYVYINVTRNPQGPLFINSPYNATLHETVPTGTTVVQVSAYDPDGELVTYSLQNTPPASLYFRIDPITGVITTRAILYEDTVNSYNIKVYASDNNAASKSTEATVTVYIIRNPNPPVFAQGSYNVSVSEYANIGKSVITIRATDADPVQSAGGVLRYTFGTVTPTRGISLFDISPTTGEITVASQLYNDPTLAPDSVILQVLAYDRSISPKTGTTTLTVNIVRNINTPRFTDGSYRNISLYSSTFVPVDVVNLAGTDDDEDVPLNADTPNAEISYSLKDTNGIYNNFFEVTQTGVLRLVSNVYVPGMDSNVFNVSN